MTIKLPPKTPYGHIRNRSVTEQVVVHYVDIEHRDDNDALLALASRYAQAATFEGHGVHFVVLPDGRIAVDRPYQKLANINRQFNENSIVVRVLQIDSELTEEAKAAHSLDKLHRVVATYCNEVVPRLWADGIRCVSRDRYGSYWIAPGKPGSADDA